MRKNLSKIRVSNPVDLVISQIRDLISSGTIKPGEKLPPERKLAEQFAVSRHQVREAIIRLQLYGIVKVVPQSGTIVSGLGITAIQGLITDILKIEQPDFKSLVDTRILLEKEVVRIAAINRTKDDLVQMSLALDLYEKKLMKQNIAIEEDLLFHIKIAEASQNSVLKSFMMIITPDILKHFRDLKVCNQSDNIKIIEEHREILEKIAQKNPEGAVKAMENHLKDISEISVSAPISYVGLNKSITLS